MKETKITEELFDGIFRENLADAASRVPDGIWDGISSSIEKTATSTTAGIAAKSAMWMKAVILTLSVSAISVIVYMVNESEDNQVDPVQAKQEIIQKTEGGDHNATENQAEESSSSGTDNRSGMRKAVEKRNKTEQTQSGSDRTEKGYAPESRDGSDENPDEKPVYFEMKNPEGVHTAKQGEDEKPADYKETGDAGKQTPEAEAEKPAFIAGGDSSYLFVPNVVTINNDGINDVYLISLTGEEKVDIYIYNIEDNSIIFHTDNKHNPWNCKLKNGDEAPAGSYIVKVVYKFKGKPEESTIKKLTLIR